MRRAQQQHRRARMRAPVLAGWRPTPRARLPLQGAAPAALPARQPARHADCADGAAAARRMGRLYRAVSLHARAAPHQRPFQVRAQAAGRGGGGHEAALQRGRTLDPCPPVHRAYASLDDHTHFLDCGDRFYTPDQREIDSALMPDALHPNAAGHELLAQVGRLTRAGTPGRTRARAACRLCRHCRAPPNPPTPPPLGPRAPRCSAWTRSSPRSWPSPPRRKRPPPRRRRRRQSCGRRERGLPSRSAAA